MVDNDAIKKTVYNQLLTKVNAIGSSKLVKNCLQHNDLRKWGKTPNHDKYITTNDF